MLVASGLAVALVAWLALRDDVAGTGGRDPTARVPELEPDICFAPAEHLRLRLSMELGAPSRPSLAKRRAERPRSLVLRMDRVADTLFPPAHASVPGTTAPAAGGESPAQAPVDPARPAQAAPAVPPAPATAPAPRRAASKGPIRLDLLERARDLGEPSEEVVAFAPKSWVVVVPPPPPPPPPPPEPPRAPPLPFRFAGALDDGAGRVSFFLLRGNAMLTVSVGDTIDNTYKLDGADGGVLTFTFLPLRERQQLPYGGLQ